MNQIERHFSAFGGQINQHFNLGHGKTFVDLTLGDAGHTQEALKAGCSVFSFDVDPESIKRSMNFLQKDFLPVINPTISNLDLKKNKWFIFQDNFVNFSNRLKEVGITQVDNILIDLGPSQNQVLSDSRGFSFNSEADLDMRTDPTLSVTAKDLVNVLNEGELRELFQLADENYAAPIARIIVKLRKQQPLKTCKQLADLVSRVKRQKPTQVHPATKVFMALRMAVNSERDNIKQVIAQIPEMMSSGGIAGVITFHSGEDRLVKDMLNQLVESKIVLAINKKPIEPSIDELKISKRTRSAKLRLIKKC